MGFYIRYPSTSAATVNIPAVGTNGSPIPTSSIEIGGKNGSGNLTPVSVDSTGNVGVGIQTILGSAPGATNGLAARITNGTSYVDPTQIRALTSADVVSVQGGNSTAVKVDGSATTQPVSGTVAVSNFPATQPISAVALPLPSGASTSAKQPALGTAGSASTDVITVQGIASMTALKVDASATTQPISAASLPLPTGASTSALQTTGNTSLSSIDGKLASLGQKAMAGSEPVVIASDQSAIPVSQSGTFSVTQSGTWTVQPGNTANTTAWLTNTSAKTAVNVATNSYSSVNVTTGAYVQLLASTSAAVSEVEIFDSSGQSFFLATGGAGSEVNQIYIFPGGNGRVPLKIAASTRVAIKAVSATASSGNIYINFYS